jgi:hypothetical protein
MPGVADARAIRAELIGAFSHCSIMLVVRPHQIVPI